MDDNLNDDGSGYRVPTYRDYDAERVVMKEDFESAPNADHRAAAEETFAYLRTDIAKEVLGDHKQSMVIIDNPEDVKRIEQAAAQDAANAAQAAAASASGAAPTELAPKSPAEQAVQPDPSASQPQAPGSTPDGTGDGAKKAAEKPTELETTLAGIRASADHQRRFVIAGDPAITKAFYDKLASRNQLFYQGNTPVITVSRDKALKVLQETVKEFDKASATHALSLKLDRESGGIFRSMHAAAANVADQDGRGKLGRLASRVATSIPLLNLRRHELDVVVVGKEDVIQAKLKELGSLVTAMEEHGHIKKGIAVVEDGKLKVSEETGPVKASALADFNQVLTPVKAKVETYKAEQSDLKQELRERKDESDIKSMREEKAKESRGADKDAGKAGAPEVNQHTARLAADLDKGFKDPTALTIKNEHGTPEAVMLLRSARKLRDPAEPELATLPDGARQAAVVQLAALTEKAASKEYGKPFAEELKKAPGGESSIRDKITEYVAMEAKRDPDFGAKAEVLIQSLVERKIMTEAQGAAVSATVAEAVTAAKDAAAKTVAPADSAKAAEAGAAGAPAQQASADTAAAKEGAATTAESGQAGTTAKDAGKVSEAQQSGAEPRAAADSRDAGVSADAGKTQGADNASALAATSSAQPDAGKVTAADPASAEKAAGPETTGAPKAGTEAQSTTAPASSATTSGEATASAADKPLTLRDRIEAMANDGPAKLTEDKAHSLVAELDAIRTKPLSSLDASSGDKPTQTLVRAEALLKELETGRLGPELKAQAKDLSDSLQKWGQQDAARYEKDASLATSQRSDVVAQAKSAEPAWQGQAPAPRQEAAAPAQQAPSEAPKAPAGEASAAAKDAAQAAPRAPTEGAPAADTAREQAVQRLAATEMAGAKLSMMMSNPAGSFTNRDKSWNQESVQRAASEVLRIDPDVVSHLSAQQRTKVAMYSAWVAQNASEGKLPGFSSDEGKAQAAQLVERAAALISKMDDGSKPTPEVLKSVEKAERMVDSMAQLEKSSSMSSQASREDAPRRAVSDAAAGALAKDLVHSVYRQNEMSDTQAKHLLSTAPLLTPETTKSLAPETRAQVAVAMGHLAQQVKDGAMGDFAALPTDVKRNALAAGEMAGKLANSMSKDPSMKELLSQATSTLEAKNAAATSSASASAPKAAGVEPSKDNSGVAPAAGKQDGRSHDR